MNNYIARSLAFMFLCLALLGGILTGDFMYRNYHRTEVEDKVILSPPELLVFFLKDTATNRCFFFVASSKLSVGMPCDQIPNKEETILDQHP